MKKFTKYSKGQLLIEIIDALHKGKSIQHRIRMALEGGMKLTQADANKYPFCTSRLGAFIHKLRKEENLDIQTEHINVVCMDGHIATVGRYKLIKK